MTAPREIADRREAYEDDADNVRGDYHAAIGSLVDMAKAQAKRDRELAQLRATVKRVEALAAALDDLPFPRDPHVVADIAEALRAALEGDQ